MISDLTMLALLIGTFIVFGAALALGLLIASRPPCRRR
jgi:hypothetical protein